MVFDFENEWAIEFGARALDDLRRRIEAYRWPDIGLDRGWTTGTNDAVLRDLVATWLRAFDWRAVERALNAHAHVRVPIEGEAMHAMLAAGPARERRLPLLLLHGWPNSFADYAHVTTLLSTAGDDGPPFDVVVPSLPGFGFSEPVRVAGLHPGRVAERLHRLMRRLGYARYGVHGGDWGAIIGTALALRHPEAVAGLHLTHLPGRPAPTDGPPLADEERRYLDRLQPMRPEESGYVAIQGSRPQTLAYAQNDSPVGLLAWIDGLGQSGLDGHDLRELGLKNGNLTVDDQRSGKHWTFSNINVILGRPAQGGVIFRVESENPERPWQLSAAMRPSMWNSM